MNPATCGDLVSVGIDQPELHAGGNLELLE
jgi:hypothetical protein